MMNRLGPLALAVVLAMGLALLGAGAAGPTRAQTPPAGPATDRPEGLGEVPPPNPDQRADERGATPRGAVPNGVNPFFSYHYVAGAALQPHQTGASLAYDGQGCKHITNTPTDRLLVADMQLPEGSVIKFLRYYYRNTVAGGAGSALITRFDAGTTTQDLAAIASGTGLGVGTMLSSEITHTVDTFGFAYVLYALPAANVNRVCGLRVAYHAPLTARSLFQPLIRRDN
jgi:hypothetical protein